MPFFEGAPDYLKEILLKDKFSRSERHGISLLTPKDLKVYSPGISTGGVAEIKMALSEPKRTIVATTIDEKGIAEVTWDDVENRRKEYLEWKEARLILDTANTTTNNLNKALEYIQAAEQEEK